MKRFFFAFIIITLIFEILMFPKDAMEYAALGLSLWFENMIPALFPFMVISALIIRLDIAPYIVSFLHPILNKLYHTTPHCEYAIVMGFLCGYPMGAVIIKDLLNEGKITLDQANYLLTFCNNIGPVFFASIVLPIFNTQIRPILLIGMYGIPLLYGFFMRYTVYRNVFTSSAYTTASKGNKQISKAKDSCFFDAFSASLNQAVSASLFLGACMIFFNMLRFLPAMFLRENLILQTLACWLLESNGAIHNTQILCNENEHLALLFIPFLSVGGLSCLCQTAGILHNTGCHLAKHFTHKILQALLWFGIMLLWHLNYK